MTPETIGFLENLTTNSIFSFDGTICQLLNQRDLLS